MDEARRDLAAVIQVRERIDAQALSPRVSGLLGRLDKYLPWFQTAIDGALLAPGLLGAEGPRTYLLIAQNSQELRPTGGLISGVGELKIENGQLGSLSFSDGYAVDNLKVPHEITPLAFQQTLFGELWFFRDTNWDADFPTSARRALDVYARDRGVQADGVITVDLSALRLLVDAVAPLQVEGIPEAVTGKNVLAVIQAQYDQPAAGSDGDWWRHRKDFMGQIARAAMDRIMTGHGLQPVTLAKALKTALDEKHILVYLADHEAADLLRERDWDGALAMPAVSSDVLAVVDTNVGFNKADAKITRSIGYQVDLAAEEGPLARLVLTYQHGSKRPVGDCIQESRYGETYSDMMNRCYWDYVRVHVPGGSQLLQGPDIPLPPGSMLARNSDELATQSVSPTLTVGQWAVWAAFFDVPTMGGRTLVFDYRLPQGLLEYGPDGVVRYRLRVQKQPGTEAVPLHVTLILPPGAEVVDAVPADLPSVSTSLRVDREFSIAFREREGGP
jgi:hypothetical protein